MRRFLILFSVFGLVTVLYARAGGGGSYRSSSSSSSSRSSSSSSSRSSSSSYSSSSSSSSYKSSSSSSGYRSSGGSSYSGPSYKSVVPKGLTLTYNFDRPGKINVAQTFVFDVKGAQGDGFQIATNLPETPATPEGLVYDKTQLAKTLSGANFFAFKLAQPTVGQHSVSLIRILAFAPTPTATGASFEMASPCETPSGCTVKFKALPPQTRLQLLVPDTKQKGFYAVRGEKAGPDAEFTGAELAGIPRLRIIATDEAMRLAAVEAWNKSTIVSSSEPVIDIGEDGEIAIAVKFKTAGNVKPEYLAMDDGPGNKDRYLIAKTLGLNGGYIRDYGESYFYLGSNSGYGFGLIGAAAVVGGKEKIRLPLSAPNQKYYAMTGRQDKTEFINQYPNIRINLPPGVEAVAEITECRDLLYGGCQQLRPIAVRSEVQGGALNIVPLEAQITGLWFLDLEITKGSIGKPGFWKKMRYGFGHHHEFGKYPRWVFWFYFLTIIAALTGLIVFFVKLRGIKRRRAERKKAAEAEENALREIKKRDPAFDAEAFKERGRNIAERIQHAWSAGDMRECRRFLSQGVYNRFRVQLKIMREHEKRQNAMADFKILGFHIAARQRSGGFDCLIVRLDAEARDVMISAELSAADAHEQAKKAPLTPFVEYYSFMRRRDAKTGTAASLDACSRCGTPFTGEGEITKCKSCAAVMGSGTFDWVLAEITQEVEYGKGKRFVMPTKEMSGDRIEDRASFIFWRDVLTGITGKNDFLLRDATDRYLEKSRSAAPWLDVSVGAADMESYDDALSPVRAEVRIKWSAKGPADKEIRHRESILSLIAQPGFESGSGFAEHSCDTCGAPLPETDAETCAYCRSPIQRKNKDWLLDKVKTTVE